MSSLHLKFVLLSFVWFAIALAVLGRYLRTLSFVYGNDFPYWVWPLFVFAGLLTLFGKWKHAFLVGVPAFLILLLGFLRDLGRSFA